MILPSQSASATASLISQYPPATQHQIALITRRLLVLGFAGAFTRMVEGPVVCTFYFKPQGDSQFSRVMNKEEELAGALSVESVRVERLLGEIAIALPRADRQTIYFDKCIHTMMTSEATASMMLPLLMGQSPDGTYLYTDLASQPHLLVAGATGSGKSVFVSQLICSLSLFRRPDDLEFILVDTKNLDLVLFKPLEHVRFILNTIPDIRAVLSELLNEVRFRNGQMSGVARNIGEWNRMYGDIDKRMKYKVVIIDELADVFDQDEAMLRPFPRKERPPSIQELLKQIAQIARAAGIHLIGATQRPSVDTLPGDIKTNFPARVSFKLPSQIDSRVIIDEKGAESLLGKGDYLYKVSGNDTVKRAHSAYVTMGDIATIIEQNEMIRRSYAKDYEAENR
jgi:DNA segregation ATPase FtsK/SpoIIIE, S-DNA-T family